MKTKLLASFLFFSALLASGCGGTGTGNPTGSANGPAAGLIAATHVLNAICSKLQTCYTSLSGSQCSAGVLAQTDLAAPLGLSSSFGTYQAIVNAETAGTITPNIAAENACLSDLGALSCSSSAVQTAYSAGSPGDFSQVFNLIPTSSSSCKGLY
jgi:hypothetical protein